MIRPRPGQKSEQDQLLRGGSFIFCRFADKSFMRAYWRSVTLSVRTLPFGGSSW